MPLPYQEVYNERAVANLEPFNTEALSYLDENFKEQVTSAMERCLDERPEDPVKFVADALKEQCLQLDNTAAQPSKLASDSFSIHVDGGILVTVKSVHDQAKPPQYVAGLPIMHLQMPTLYDMQKALDLLRETNAAATDEADGALRSLPSVVVIVEPPSAPAELVFLKGIPYTHGLTETLAQRSRRGMGPESSADKVTVRERALALLKSAIGEDLAGLTDAIQATFAAEGGGGNASLVVLPAVQTSYMDVYDQIDHGFRQVTHPRLLGTIAKGVRNAHGESDAELLAWKQQVPPVVLFASFNPVNAPLTLARILSTFVPYYETTKLRELSAMRAANMTRVRKYDLEFCSEYWRAVHKRREAADAAMVGTAVAGSGAAGSRRAVGAVAKKAAATRPPSATTADEVKASNTTVPSTSSPPPPAAAVVVQQQRAREARREREDTAFLEVVRALEAIAASAVQANFRGHRARRRVHTLKEEKKMASAEKLAHGDGTSKSPTTHGKAATKRSAVRHDTPYPEGVPPLLRLVAERLSEVHGELFGNYDEAPKPEPRLRPIFIPQLLAPSNDGSGGTEEGGVVWSRELAAIPPKRACDRLPHFNPLRRVLEYHRLAGCDILHEALLAQKQLGGLSALQHRAYNMLKSVALDVLHVAHTELFHRGLLSVDAARFSHYVRRQHAVAMSWFSQPHRVSRGVAAAQRALRNHAEGTSDRAAASVDTHVLEHEGVLLCGTGPVQQAFSTAFHQQRAQQGRGASVRIAENVYLTATAQPMRVYEGVVAAVRQDLRRQMHPGAAPGTTPAGVSTPEAQSGSATEVDVGTSTSVLCGDGSCGVDEVILVNMCPHPVAYVNETAVVLAPVSPTQTLAGRPASNHVVLRMEHPESGIAHEVVRGVGTEGDALTVAPPATPQNRGSAGAPDSSENPVAPTEALTFSAKVSWKKGFSHVVDGIEFRRRSLYRAADGARSTEDSALSLAATSARRFSVDNNDTDDKESADTHATSMRDGGATMRALSGVLGGGSLPQEECAFARALRATFSERGALEIFQPAEAGPHYVAAMSARYLEPKRVSLADVFADHTASLKQQQHGQRTPQQPSTDSPRAADVVPQNSVEGCPSHTRNASPTRRGFSPTTEPQSPGSPLGTRAGAPHEETTPRTAKMSPAASAWTSDPPRDASPLRRAASSVSGRATAVVDLGDVVVPSRTAFLKHTSFLQDDHLSLRYRRMWLPAGLAGLAWVQRLDQFVATIFADIKAAKLLAHQRSSAKATGAASTLDTKAVVLMAQPDCAEQIVFVTAAMLLADALERAMSVRPLSGAFLSPALSAGRPMGTPAEAGAAPPANEQSGGTVGKKSPLNKEDLGFLGDFVDMLHNAFCKAGVDVMECVQQVNDALVTLEARCNASHCLSEVPSSCTFNIASLLADVEAARSEPVAARCKSLILRVTQQAEQLCWLILLQVFLSQPFLKPALDATRDTPLTSFGAFASSVDGALAWMEAMDPWAACPASCPDPYHARYSNGLRRWDDTSYICFGAI